jgi:hypothetical protein
MYMSICILKQSILAHCAQCTETMQGAKTYLDGMHVYSLALLASQPQYNLLCCLSLQAATPRC